MGKASRAKQAPKEPKIDHFTMGTEDYIALRRYLGSKPHDETRQLIEILERMPAVTEDDVALLVKQAERLAELASQIDSEVLVFSQDYMAPPDTIERKPDDNAEIGGENAESGQIVDKPAPAEEEVFSDPDSPPGDDPVAKDHEEEQ